MKRMIRGDDARAAGRGPPELQCSLDRFGSRAREQHAREPVRRSLQQLLGEQARQERDPELHRSWSVQLERLDQRCPDSRVVAARVEHPEASEEIEVAVAARVVEVLPFGS